MLSLASVLDPVWLTQLGQGASDPTMPTPAARDVASTILYAGVILTAAVVVGFVAFAIRKRLVADDQPDASMGLGFTHADLRQMHEAGEISDAEFARAMSKLVAHARADLDEDADAENDDQVHLDPDPANEDPTLGPEDSDGRTPR